MFYFLSKVLDLAASPLTWAIVLSGVCVFIRAESKYARWRLYGPVLASLLLLVFSLEPTSNALIRSLEEPVVRTVRDDRVYDAAVVLGGMVDEQTTATWREPAFNSRTERMFAAYSLYKKGKARAIVVSGGSPDQVDRAYIEAQVVVDMLETMGVPREALVVEPEARNTRENATLVAAIAKDRAWSSLVIITSAFHMRRALGCFRAVGLDVDALPTDFESVDGARFPLRYTPRAEFLHKSTYALREHVGRRVYRFSGYAKEL